MKIAVAGTGYVGLVTGVCLASKGHQVTCVDVDEKKVEIMRQGISPIYEPGLSELMKENMLRLIFTTNYEKAYSDAEVIFIGVGTPEKKMVPLTCHMYIKLQNRLQSRCRVKWWLL